MWKPLSVISGLVLLAAGGVMYTQVRNPILSERKQLENAKKNKETALETQKASKAALAQAGTDVEDAKRLLAANQSKKNDAQSAKDAKVAEVTATTGEKDTAAKELAELEEKLKGLGSLDQLLADLKVLEAKKALLTSNIDNTKGAIQSSISQKEATDKVVSALQLKELYQKTGTMVANFRSRVSAVNPELGFVVLSHGNASNVTKGAKFDVYRGERGVARIIVTHLEQNRSIAEVIPGTQAAGESVLPGDVAVISSVSTPRSMAQPAPAPAASPSAQPAPATELPGGEVPAETTPAPETAPAETPAPETAPAETPAPEAAPSEEMTPNN